MKPPHVLVMYTNIHIRDGIKLYYVAIIPKCWLNKLILCYLSAYFSCFVFIFPSAYASQ